MKRRYIVLAVVLMMFPLFLSTLLNLAISQSYLNDNIILMTQFESVLKIWQVICYPYWLMVGSIFYNLSKNKKFNLMIFIIPVGLLLTIFIVQSTLLPSHLSMSQLYLWTQMFPLGFVRAAAILLSLLPFTINSVMAVIVSYGINAVVFLVGFYKLNSVASFLDKTNK